MSKVILFSRVSSLGQDLTQQNNELYAEAKRNSFNEEDIILIEQKESAIKLDEDERIGIQKLKEAIEKENVECVIIYEISRLARRPTVLYSVRDYLIEHKVNLICMKPYMRLLDPDGKMSQTASILFSLFSSLSESEMMIKRERLMRGRLAKRDQGKYIGGNVLFGYTWDAETDKIHIDENKRPVIIEIFKRYIENESIRSIAKDLLDRGLLPYDDYSTAVVMMRRAIHRSEYAGIKGTTYDYPPIISQELYYKVRERAESKNKYKTRLSEIYYLQGIIYYKRTGMRMSPGKQCVQYRAWDERTNSGTIINLNYIESLAWHEAKLYKQRMNGPERMKSLESLVDEIQRNIQRQQTAIEEYNKVQNTIERINERVVKGKMSDEQGDRLIEEQKDRIKDLDKIMAKCSENRILYEKQLNGLETEEIDYDELNDEQKKRIIKEAIKKVVIDKDGESSKGKLIDIYFNDGGKKHLHMIKRGNYFSTFIGDKEYKFEMIERFIRKNYDKR